MTLDTYLRFVLALVFVLALIAACAWAAKKFGLGQRLGSGLPRGRNARLSVVETLALDARRKLVLVRRDDHEHLLVLGPAGETVIESRIAASPAAAPVRLGDSA